MAVNGPSRDRYQAATTELRPIGWVPRRRTAGGLTGAADGFAAGGRGAGGVSAAGRADDGRVERCRCIGFCDCRGDPLPVRRPHRPGGTAGGLPAGVGGEEKGTSLNLYE